MCGRFASHVTAEVIAALFGLEAPAEFIEARYNIAPTQPVGIVRLNGAGARGFTWVNWGLIPSWASDPSIGNRMINARAETAAMKPSFRSAMRYRRCIVPAGGYYEWYGTGKNKQPFFIRRMDGLPLAMGGIWEHWQSADGSEIESCAILTTAANATLKPLHERMPVLLAREDFERWLDPRIQDAGNLVDLMEPHERVELEFYPVSTYVNSPGNEGVRCIQESLL